MSLLVGRPDFELSGSWWIKVVRTRAREDTPLVPRLHHRPPSELRRDVAGAGEGTVLVIRSPEEAERCVAAAVEARLERRAPVCVLHAGPIPPPLLIALTRAGVAAREIPPPTTGTGASALESGWWSPFPATTVPNESAPPDTPPQRGSPAGRGLLSAFSVDVRVGRQLGVVVPVSADELPLLADLLALLRIPHQTPLIICPIDGPAPAAAIAEQMGLSPRATLVPIDSAPGHDGCLLAALTAAADRADAAYWALLSPAAIPLHGADLFTGDHWRRFDVVAPAEAFTEIDDLAHTHLRTSGLPLPARIAPGTIVRHTVPGPPISLFSRKAIERLGALPTAMTASAEIGLTLACLGQSLELAVTHVDAGTLGWRT